MDSKSLGKSLKSILRACSCIYYLFYRLCLPRAVLVITHSVESAQIQSLLWSVFCLIRTDLRIQSEYGKIRTRKTSVFGYFSRSDRVTLRKGLRKIHFRFFSCQRFRFYEIGGSSYCILF